MKEPLQKDSCAVLCEKSLVLKCSRYCQQLFDDGPRSGLSIEAPFDLSLPAHPLMIPEDAFHVLAISFQYLTQCECLNSLNISGAWSNQIGSSLGSINISLTDTCSDCSNA